LAHSAVQLIGSYTLSDHEPSARYRWRAAFTEPGTTTRSAHRPSRIHLQPLLSEGYVVASFATASSAPKASIPIGDTPSSSRGPPPRQIHLAEDPTGRTAKVMGTRLGFRKSCGTSSSTKMLSSLMAHLLRQCGFDAVSAHEAGHAGRLDLEQIRFATREERLSSRATSQTSSRSCRIL
jgi:hypothetical protein